LKAVLAVLTLLAASTFGDWIYGLWHGPLHLACQGQNVWTLNDEKNQNALHIVIDFGKGTVDVESFPVQFAIESTRPYYIHFNNKIDQYTGGFLNRYTGAITVTFGKPEDQHNFNGACHKAEPLF
jgi:hypothetical protein